MAPEESCTIQVKGTDSWIKLINVKWPLQIFMSKYYQATISDWGTSIAVTNEDNTRSYKVGYEPHYFLIVNWSKDSSA